MGLLSIGAAEASADAHAAEMLAYAHDTNHEKIIRGLSVGLALLCYGREEGADSMVEQLCTDQVRRTGYVDHTRFPGMSMLLCGCVAL